MAICEVCWHAKCDHGGSVCERCWLVERPDWRHTFEERPDPPLEGATWRPTGYLWGQA